MHNQQSRGLGEENHLIAASETDVTLGGLCIRARNKKTQIRSPTIQATEKLTSVERRRNTLETGRRPDVLLPWLVFAVFVPA
jgi:hypothetical protein